MQSDNWVCLIQNMLGMVSGKQFLIYENFWVTITIMN